MTTPGAMPFAASGCRCAVMDGDTRPLRSAPDPLAGAERGATPSRSQAGSARLVPLFPVVHPCRLCLLWEGLRLPGGSAALSRRDRAGPRRLRRAADPVLGHAARHRAQRAAIRSDHLDHLADDPWGPTVRRPGAQRQRYRGLRHLRADRHRAHYRAAGTTDVDDPGLWPLRPGFRLRRSAAVLPGGHVRHQPSALAAVRRPLSSM